MAFIGAIASGIGGLFSGGGAAAGLSTSALAGGTAAGGAALSASAGSAAISAGIGAGTAISAGGVAAGGFSFLSAAKTGLTAFSVLSPLVNAGSAIAQDNITQSTIGLQRQLARSRFEQQKAISKGIIAQGMATQAAFASEASFLDMQIALQQKDLLEQAQYVKRGNKRFLASQTVAFTKTMLDLSGTPLDVLEETRVEGLKDVEAVLDRAEALGELGGIRSRRLRGQGRAVLSGAKIQANQFLSSASLELSGSGLLFDSQLSNSRAVRNSAVLSSIVKVGQRFIQSRSDSDARNRSGILATTG